MIYIIKEFNKKNKDVKIIKTNNKKILINLINNLIYNKKYFLYNCNNYKICINIEYKRILYIFVNDERFNKILTNRLIYKNLKDV